MAEDDELDEGSDWFGTKTGAAYIGIQPRTLYRLINEGQVPAYKIGRVIRLRRADLDAFLEEARIQPGSLDHLRNQPRGEEGPGGD